IESLQCRFAMSVTRRDLLRYMGMGVAMRSVHAQPQPVLYDLTTLPRFVDSLPMPQLATPVERAHHRISMQPFEARVHRDMRPATFWVYGGSCPGATFDVRHGEAISVEWVNNLPREHM